MARRLLIPDTKQVNYNTYFTWTFHKDLLETKIRYENLQKDDHPKVKIKKK